MAGWRAWQNLSGLSAPSSSSDFSKLVHAPSSCDSSCRTGGEKAADLLIAAAES